MTIFSVDAAACTGAAEKDFSGELAEACDQPRALRSIFQTNCVYRELKSFSILEVASDFERVARLRMSHGQDRPYSRSPVEHPAYRPNWLRDAAVTAHDRSAATDFPRCRVERRSVL